jgi:hypothetical protein
MHVDRNEKCIQNFGQKIRRDEITLTDLNVMGRDNIKMDLEEIDVRVRTRFNWLWINSNSGL